MPKPNFVRRPMDKIMDMKINDLPNPPAPEKTKSKPLFGSRPKKILFDDYVDLKEDLLEADAADILRDLGDKD